MEIKVGNLKCEKCDCPIVIKAFYTPNKDDEIALECPWCKEVIGLFKTVKNKSFIVYKG